ncbi:hypothetical protein [Methylomonas methanica]|uniref:Beta-lactamase-inhibitor-like PepSY-like domain-containing protein n=1 Tax=Methylomonas methanica (strain DSM 25384 / MC09) TaxID=857087 RepID=G0A5Y2_METMM|nr:hypothetical protein [Methylomonas methanica]AEF99259.1 hypothetical protein Metme_0820 [Methylomonas methanica MC09]
MFNRKALITTLLVCLLGANAEAAEVTEVSFDALPEAVKTTARGIIDKQSISKISQVNDNSLIRFELEADKIQNDKSVVRLDLVIAANGKLMKLAREVPYYSLSYPQMQLIEKRYPGIKVTEAESVDIHFFDVVGDMAGKPVKFRLYEDGLIEDQSAP